MKNVVCVRKLARLLVAGALAALAVPGAAHAATVALEPRAGGVEQLNYRAAPGELNRVLVDYKVDARVWTVTDSAGLSAGPGCSLVASGRVDCTVPSAARASGVADVDLGDGDDAVAVLGAGLVRAVLTGGDGDDVLLGGPEDDSFWQGRRADGADRMVGGNGSDAVDYSGRRSGVHAAIGRQGRNGARGEDDAIAGDVEGLIGGRGRDVLRGNGEENVLVGGRGDDRLRGGRGYDVLAGGPGGDAILARDGSIDSVACGSGADRAQLDGLDFFAGRCDRVTRDRRGGATVIYITYDQSGRLLVDVGCPGDVRAQRCVGKLAMAVDGRSLGRERVDLARGTRGLVTFALPADVAERLKAGGRTTAMSVLASHTGRVHRRVTVRWSLPLRG